MWCRLDARLWHVYYYYKPFTWCLSDARLWHACYYLIQAVSGVAQTPDGGMSYITYVNFTLIDCSLSS